MRQRRQMILPQTRFHKLTVVGIDHKSEKNRSYLYLCKCDCGNFTIVAGSKLKRNDIYATKSCGCLKKENIKPKFSKKHHAFSGYKNILGSVWCRIVSSAKLRKLEITISIKDLHKLYIEQEGKCKLTGVPIKFAETSKALKNGENTASLDRIDPTKGYIKSNVQIVHRDINYMKMRLPQDKFIELCKQVADYARSPKADIPYEY